MLGELGCHLLSLGACCCRAAVPALAPHHVVPNHGALDGVTVTLQEKGKGGAANLERLLLPLSSLSGWGLTAVGALMVMHVLGVNIQPLLTVGGVGGLAFGFGAQAVTSNAISGLNLFLTRPFVIGGAQGS